jgi:hypothetical protein
MLKRLFYASASICLLALAYHLGATSATAQVGSSNPVVAAFGVAHVVVTANGDVYEGPTTSFGGPWVLVSNVFSSPTSATQATWGQVKARYRPDAPQDKQWEGATS